MTRLKVIRQQAARRLATTTPFPSRNKGSLNESKYLSTRERTLHRPGGSHGEFGVLVLLLHPVHPVCLKMTEESHWVQIIKSAKNTSDRQVTKTPKPDWGSSLTSQNNDAGEYSSEKKIARHKSSPARTCNATLRRKVADAIHWPKAKTHSIPTKDLQVGG